MENQPNTSNQNSGVRTKGPDEKFCESCGEIINIKAEICLKCGVRQKPRLSKAVLLLITFFLGGMGAHKFYTGRNWLGVLYLIFFWTGIPGLIALIEFIVYAFTSSEKLQEKYSASRGGTVIAILAGCIGFIALLGILAAIAIPNFVAYQEKARASEVKAILGNIATGEESYYAEYDTYTTDLSKLGIDIPDAVRVQIVTADDRCFLAEATKADIRDVWTIDCERALKKEPKK